MIREGIVGGVLQVFRRHRDVGAPRKRAARPSLAFEGKAPARLSLGPRPVMASVEKRTRIALTPLEPEDRDVLPPVPSLSSLRAVASARAGAGAWGIPGPFVPEGDRDHFSKAST